MDSHETILDEIRRCNDDQLIAGLEQTLRKQRGASARLIAFMAEIDERRLYRDHAHTSMFSYAVEELHMSEDEACVRIGAARTCRAYPVVLGMLARGELHLSGVRQLSSVLTPDNHLELLDVTRFKSRRAIERLLAERFPKPDVRNEMRKLPSRAPGGDTRSSLESLPGTRARTCRNARTTRLPLAFGRCGESSVECGERRAWTARGFQDAGRLDVAVAFRSLQDSVYGQ